jgi:hypothetical protein
MLKSYKPSENFYLKNIIEDHKSYISSYLSYNEEIIRSSRAEYERLKRFILDIKYQKKLLKLEEKNLKIMAKAKENYQQDCENLLKRCKKMVDELQEKVKEVVVASIDSHLFAFKNAIEKPCVIRKSSKKKNKNSERVLEKLEEELFEDEEQEDAEELKIDEKSKRCKRSFSVNSMEISNFSCRLNENAADINEGASVVGKIYRN